MVRSDMKGRGLGYALLDALVAYGRRVGLDEIFGEALMENTTMLRLAKELGFVTSSDPEEPGIVRLRLDLRGPADTR
jgi:acetyltransferase